MSIEPGLYVHSKSNKHYRVLFLAQWLDGRDPEPDVPLGVHVLDSDGVALWVWRQASSSQHKPFMLAKWSGNKPCAWRDSLVIYVALYDEGRVSVRTVAEFEEIVQINGKDVPRFVRVGD